MKDTIKSIRGMRDIVPPETALWRAVERRLVSVLDHYGYRELRTPVIEPTALFTRSIGEATDIVQKEMYTFVDRNGESLTLRPEGTASGVRALVENGLTQSLPLRLWYLGPMFRHERPQKGRYRQFHQLGIEVFGLDGPDIDAELILMTADFWRALGLDDLTLEINSLGTPETRARYRQMLVDYFTPHADRLDEDSRDRLTRNPLRILDSKHPDMQTLIAAAPPMSEALDAESTAHFEGLKAILDAAGLAYVVNPRLVRGLDYYTHTVFEWKTRALGAQDTVCAGGRYDGLVETFGAKPTSAIGFAAGLERLIALVDPDTFAEPDALAFYVVAAAPDAAEIAVRTRALRAAFPTAPVTLHCGGGSMKSQMKKADRSGASHAVVLGEDEIARDVYTVKPLRGGEQFTAPLADLPARLGVGGA